MQFMKADIFYKIL